jgi:hypothetical protein
VARLDAIRSVAIVVASCDRYRDLWDPFFYLFRRVWPDCEHPLYLVSNSSADSRPGVVNLAVGEDVTWSANLRRALERVQEPYVILLLEDLLMFTSVNAERLHAVLTWMIESGANMLKLNPVPAPDRDGDSRVGKVQPGAHYRVSTVATVWRKAVLLALLDDKETAWEFELRGSLRSNVYDKFFACRKPHFPVVNGIVRGKWRPRVLKAALSMGAPVHPLARPLMTSVQSAAYRVALWRYYLLQALPSKIRLPLRNLLRGA